MSKLSDLTRDFLEAKNAEIQEIVSMKTGAAEAFVREKVVIPYCKRTGYRFSAGMGTWSFFDRDGEHFCPGETRHKRRGCPSALDPASDDDCWFLEPTLEDCEIRDILSFQFDCQNQSIGAYMADYQP